MVDQSTPRTLPIFLQGRINSCGRKAPALSSRQDKYPVLLAIEKNTGKRSTYFTNHHHVESANILDDVMKSQWILRVLCLISSASVMFVSYYRPHPKDGEGNVFSLSTPVGGYLARWAPHLVVPPQPGGHPTWWYPPGQAGTLPGDIPLARWAPHLVVPPLASRHPTWW